MSATARKARNTTPVSAPISSDESDSVRSAESSTAANAVVSRGKNEGLSGFTGASATARG